MAHQLIWYDCINECVKVSRAHFIRSTPRLPQLFLETHTYLLEANRAHTPNHIGVLYTREMETTSPDIPPPWDLGDSFCMYGSMNETKYCSTRSISWNEGSTLECRIPSYVSFSRIVVPRTPPKSLGARLSTLCPDGVSGCSFVLS